MLANRSSDSNLSVSFVVLAFARPDSTLELIRRIRGEMPDSPVQVLVDVPRTGSLEYIVEKNSLLIDRLKTHEMRDENLTIDVAAENLGTTLNLIRGLDAASLESDAFVVLEDDCLPESDFFEFARVALDLIESNKGGLLSFTGANHYLPPLSLLSKSAFRSELSHVWGWGMPSYHWPELRRFLLNPPDVAAVANEINKRLVYKVYRRYWMSLLEHDWSSLSWDYKYQFWIWVKNGTVLVPGRNLITNVGHDDVSTNSSQTSDHYQNPTRGKYVLQRSYGPPLRLLTFWELTGFRAFALKRLIMGGIQKIRHLGNK